MPIIDYQCPLDYAKERPPGRLISCKDPEFALVNIIDLALAKFVKYLELFANPGIAWL